MGEGTPLPPYTTRVACGASTLAPSAIHLRLLLFTLALDFPANAIPGSAYVFS